MQQLDYTQLYDNNIFHERNDMVLFILSVSHGGYNMIMRCNQKFVIYKKPTTVVWISVIVCASIRASRVKCVRSTFGDFHFTARWTEK